jgi:hypothetical protein
MAVLATPAGLHRDDALDLYLVAAPRQAHLVREVEQLIKAVVWQPPAFQGMLLREPGALVQHLTALW